MSDFFRTQELIEGFEPAFTPALFERSVLIVGLGGNGTHLALAAVRMGFARVIGIDCDVVSESNLSRQVLYTRYDIGRRKADAAAEALARHNLRSAIETHNLDILAERRHFGELVAAADLVFVVLDQPASTFFALDACYHHRKFTVTGGTCVLSGLATRVGWMGPGQRPCLNCAFSAHAFVAPWTDYFRYDGGRPKKMTEEVARLDREIALEGGHPSVYPAACLGSNLMMAAALNVLMGKANVPRLLEFSLLGPQMEARQLRQRPSCPTCALDKGT
jgi:molybdopterin/thiamine biosynthesis adenylyltransferase